MAVESRSAAQSLGRSGENGAFSRPRLAACLIVRDEERVIERCVALVRPLDDRGRLRREVARSSREYDLRERQRLLARLQRAPMMRNDEVAEAGTASTLAEARVGS